MKANLSKQEWNSYTKQELETFSPVFARLDITLDTDQLHTAGERYLMSGKKLVLTGERKDDKKRIIIKVSSYKAGRSEIRYEKDASELIQKLSFATSTILSPKELYFEDTTKGTVLVTEFIEQPKVYTSLDIREQFFLALRTLEEQEGFNAVTYEHEKDIKKTFSIFRSSDYLKKYKEFVESIEEILPDDDKLHSLLKRASMFLTNNMDTIDRYSPYLTHTDLAPHNMRISDHGIFLLDYAAFRFGNKYEGLARFLNYMLIHSPKLEKLILDYLHRDRGKDEYLSLQLMRVYQIGFLLEYYVQSLNRTTGDLHKLTKTRVALWTHILESILNTEEVSSKIIDDYISTRNKLRTKEETERQHEFDIV